MRVYASTGSLKPLGERLAFIDKISNLGFTAVKPRVKYPTLTEDLAPGREVREAASDNLAIGVDANQGWPVSLFAPNPAWDFERAVAFGKGCDELGVAWIEEPLDMYDWVGLAALRARVATPSAGGELHGGWHELQPLFDHGSLDLYQPDAMFCGLTVSWRVMQECRTRGLHFSPHASSNGFNLLVNLHAFAGWEQHQLLEYPFEPPQFVPAGRDGILPPIAAQTNGTVAVP